ncbi:hypothetical protein AQ1689_70120 [Tenacibaculum maritimum]|uniref:hypothetical protein n=1 Tax=Tenacibaculum maritimum TaxID=107401 RepID=UPI0012E4FE1C|nr:hypothetical protein [Tenacibaculum maritimum]CAA0190635.1 hypothetical protein AQ1689_70120 [Tenacibaculum maritimum]CAA0194506.1 hypothetical protein AQ1688_60121 [Tenacibaculum maritimum]CAA0197696.1 hypothetical protein AQ1685_70121 [Tenacibaculum maritimum]
MKVKDYFLALILCSFIHCKRVPTYAIAISECLEQSRKDYLSSGKRKLFKNPLRKYLDEKLVGMKMNNLTFKDKKGTTIHLNKTGKPVYIQTFSRRVEQCNRELEALNILVEKYQDKVTFILLINKNHESNPLCNNKLYRKKSPEDCTPNKYHPSIHIIYFTTANLEGLEDGYGEMIYGIRNIEYPTCYYLNKNNTIFKITTIEDIIVATNKIALKNSSLHEKELSQKSFESRVPTIINELIAYNATR